MSRSLIGTVLVIALPILFMLLKREREKKAAELQAQFQLHGYSPNSIDEYPPDAVTKLADTTVRWHHRIGLVVLLIRYCSCRVPHCHRDLW